MTRRNPGASRHMATVLAAVAMTAAAPALAHTGEGLAGGFISGFTHPILGWDHVAAMVAVGLWGAFLGRPAIWILPVVFPLVMAGGAVLGIMGVPIPSVETGIAASAIALGLLIALAVRPPLWTSALIVGIFAIFHGHAHGTELPDAANPAAFAVGFVVATGLLHLTGILLGLLIALPRGALVIRGGGGLISLAGVGFLSGAF